MSTFLFGNGHARRALISNFAINGKFIINGGQAVSKMYSIGDLWGSVTIKFSGILAGSDIKVIKTSDSTILYNNTSALGGDEGTIDWFFPPATNSIQIIITKSGYYFISTIIDLDYSSNKIIFLIDQIEVATGVNTEDIAAAVWDYLESAVTVTNSMGVKVKTNLDAKTSKALTLPKLMALRGLNDV